VNPYSVKSTAGEASLGLFGGRLAVASLIRFGGMFIVPQETNNLLGVDRLSTIVKIDLPKENFH